MNYSITKNGKPLDKKLYTFDEETKTFSSNENNLVLDFSDIEGCTFDTGFGCTFKTGFGCTFKTGFDCTFKTSYDCTFDTGSGCTFKTSSGCTFDTASGCTFDTSSGCTFKTSSGCIFDTGSGCTFDTASGCTFDTASGCTFDAGSDCVVVRRDTYEVIELKENQKIKLNGYVIKGFTILDNEPVKTNPKEITIDGAVYILKN